MTRPLALLLALLAPATAAADSIYLAVGDSSAFGETDRTRNPSDGDRGYVRPFADYLATQNGGVRPTVLNLAIDGETTTSYFSGRIADRVSPDGIFHNTNYARFAPDYPSQQALLRSSLAAAAARGDVVRTVTLQLGANNLDAVAGAPDFLGLPADQQQARVAGAIGAFAGDYAQILGELRALAPAADFYVLGYHNPYAADPAHPLAGLAAPAVQGLNQAVGGVGSALGATYVDFYTPVLGRERELTLFLDGQNVHLNDEGYAVVSQELIQTAAVPAPAALPLAAAAGVVLLGFARLRRRPAA